MTSLINTAPTDANSDAKPLPSEGVVGHGARHRLLSVLGAWLLHRDRNWREAQRIDRLENRQRVDMGLPLRPGISPVEAGQVSETARGKPLEFGSGW